jgi:hypothetical protein
MHESQQRDAYTLPGVVTGPGPNAELAQNAVLTFMRQNGIHATGTVASAPYAPRSAARAQPAALGTVGIQQPRSESRVASRDVGVDGPNSDRRRPCQCRQA